MGAALVGGISICCIPMGGRGGGGHMVITSFCALVISHKPCTDIASNLLAIELQLELLAMACNRSFNMLNIYMRSLYISANFHPIFKRFSPLFLVV